MLRPTEIAVLTTAPADYDYTRVTRTLLDSVEDKHGTSYRLVAIDQDPEQGSYGRNQTERYGSGCYASVTFDPGSYRKGLGFPSLDMLLVQAQAKHDAELRDATRAVFQTGRQAFEVAAVDKHSSALEDTTMAHLHDLARAVALILMVEAHPDNNPETVKLTRMTRYQLRAALGLEED
jgi:hypothetical protein